MRGIVIAGAALLLSGCFIEPDCSAPPDFASFGAEADAVSRTDAVIRDALAAAGPLDAAAPRRYDSVARALGLSDGAELIATVSRDCLMTRDAERFATVRGLTGATAERYLSRRLGVRLCSEAISSVTGSSSAIP